MERDSAQSKCGWVVCMRAVKTPLLVLTCLAMTGILIEAYFINRLYHFKLADLERLSNLTARGPAPEPVRSCTPFAHMSGVKDGDGNVLHWREDNPLSEGCDLIYSNGSLEVQTEGYYFVFSNVAFESQQLFIHSVEALYPVYGNPVRLMGNKLMQVKGETGIPSYSHLSGIFLLSRESKIFVNINNYASIQKGRENSFGAFMLR